MEFAENREPGGSGSFVVDDDAKAEWCLRRIAELRQETLRWKAYYAAQLEKIKAQNDNAEAYFSALLERYFEGVPHKQSATQESYRLPGGKLVRKAQQPEFSRDEKELLPWVRAEVPELVKISESVDWAELKKQLVTQNGEAVYKGTGEVIPGIRVQAREPVFLVSLDREE